MTVDTIVNEIYEVPTAIRATAVGTRSAARAAAEMIRARGGRRIYIIGNGTSLYSSIAAAFTCRTLARAADPLVVAVPAGEFRHFTPDLGPDDVIVGISASGEFRDVLAVFERFRGYCPLVGITHSPDSTITRLADTILLSRGGPTHTPVMTKTYASTQTAAHLLCLELLNASEDHYADLNASADRCAEALTRVAPVVERLAPFLAEQEHAFYFGMGNAHAAALEGALKMKEMALLHAEGSETTEMASGPATMVGERTALVALYSGGASDELTAEMARHGRGWNAPIVEIGPHAYAGGWHLPVEAPVYEAFASLALVPAAALMAYRVARLRCLTPDTPHWRERYLSQGMTHIQGA